MLKSFEKDISKAFNNFLKHNLLTHRSSWRRQWAGTATVQPIRCAVWFNMGCESSLWNLKNSYWTLATSGTAWDPWGCRLPWYGK